MFAAVGVNTGRDGEPDKRSREEQLLDSVSDELREHIRTQRPIYETLARQCGFTIRFGDKTCFDHKTDTVVIGLGQLVKLGITSPKEFDFFVQHELGHFKELKDDRKGYLEVIKEGTRADGLGQIYFDFYNALMDIYVNRNTRNRAPEFEARDNSGYSREIEALYRERAFKYRDFSELPKCFQYSHYLLNLGMGVAEDIILSPKVKREIDKGVTQFGKHYSYKDFIETFLIPALGVRTKSGWQATIGERKQIIDRTLRPVFERFLEADKKEGRSLEKTGFEYLEGIEPSLEDLKSAADILQKKEEEELKPASERAKEAQHTQVKGIGDAAGLSEEEATNFAETLQRVKPVVDELVEIFKLATRETIDFQPEFERGFKRGGRLNIGDAISQFPNIQQNPAEARIMERREYQEGVSRHPSKIRLWVVPDLSGSMRNNEGVLQEITLALSAALTTLELGKLLGQHELGGALGVKGFHHEVVQVIPMGESASLSDVAKGYRKIVANGDDTIDHLALEECLAEVRRVPEEEGCLNILIEITDGATRDPNRSRVAVEALKREGVALLAFYIGTLGENSSFQDVWNRGEIQCGATVNAARDILPVIRQKLGEIFKE